ncbi:hypothetical protein [Sphingomonas sp. LY160]|uniref:hypothetical protein n=1 Tax=Sphingomonas sp. LY160 TaxID=3095342 RepID=UPI002ADEB45F|nr:hypothetical protein [Sphingomonas sp. LY160]MEA1072331.1 hypothetical protein [Sphingomonas sp. LY160]
MMKSLCALAIVSAACAPAWSQTVGGSVSTGSARHFSNLAMSGQPPSDTLRSRPCLVRKSNGRVDCRTRYEWDQLAKQIEQKREAKPN